MRVLGVNFEAEVDGLLHGHNAVLVVLSFVIAAFATYCSLDIAERLRSATGRIRLRWTAMSGLILGAGVWAMHFIGMTAFEAPLENGYEILPTVISALIVILASVTGLVILHRRVTPRRLIAAALIVSTGMIVMHYLGMTAMTVPGEMVHHPMAFGASALIAMAAAAFALWFAMAASKPWQRATGSIALALALCAIHYSAMAGIVHVAPVHHSAVHDPGAKSLIAFTVAFGAIALITIGFAMSLVDRRLSRRATVEMNRLMRVNADLEEARDAAEKATQAKSRFLATMSHEIRTPMNGILGMLEVSLQRNLEDELRDHLGTARDSATHLLTVLNDILDFSKIEAGEMPIETIPFNPRSQIEDVASLLRTQAALKGISLTTQIDHDVPDWVMGDPTRFRQLIGNLTGNAVKFTEEGGVTLVAIWSARDSRLRIEVRDTGIGFDETVRARLFARFSQADASTTRKFGGTGLGLAICRELVLAMQGEIGAESEPGAGSEFWFELPASPTEAPANANVLAPPMFTALLRILVAEDNLVNQKVVRVLLSPLGHDVHFVTDGRQAVAAITEKPFDLVLMDVHMPVMDGLEATRAIRALPGDIARVPIIALTANAMAGDREIYLHAGMDDYVTKPIHIEDLFGAIARQCSGAMADRAAREPSRAADLPPDQQAITDVSTSLDDLLAELTDSRRTAA